MPGNIDVKKITKSKNFQPVSLCTFHLYNLMIKMDNQ